MIEGAVGTEEGTDGGNNSPVFADDPAGVNIGYGQIDGGSGVGYR